MREYYLWLILCFQVALIAASGEESEHIHIKVHMPDVSRKPTTHYNRIRQQQYRKQPHPNLQQHSSGNRPSLLPHSNSPPYEFDFYGLEERGRGKHLMPKELLDSTESYGPVLFNNDITVPVVNTQNSLMSKQLMRQLFAPEMMSLLTGKDENSSHELIDVNTHRTGINGALSISKRPASLEHTNDDMLNDYFEQFNKQQQQQENDQISTPKFSSRKSNKRKKNVYGKLGSQQLIYEHRNHHLQQQQDEEQIDYEPYHNRANVVTTHFLHQPYENSSDEFETAEDTSLSTSDSNEDMTAAFNKLRPISYQDIFGAYATPFTPTNSNQGRSYRQQQTTEPTYIFHNNWRQYNHQENYRHQHPEVQQHHRRHRHHNKQKQQQQTQFLLPSSPTLHLTTSSRPSSSSATSTISSGFTSDSTNISTENLPWILPYEFVQKSQQQQHKQQQLETFKQHKHKLQKLPSNKKRNKPK